MPAIMPTPQRSKVLFRAFDIRNIIGALLGVYGVALTIVGFAPGLLQQHDNRIRPGNRVDLYVGTDANWWVGLVLIGVALLFMVWAWLRPVHREAAATAQREAEQASPGETA
ncbi:hypothetical protein [Mycobacterium sp.]|jgi:hypothetical protein|uniref:hypothetical protein n=1 Tax=Mycobacterium sp. TaxID=1785 RepID=UPI002D422BFC|nr:hypothetical protein [Mycobacterium sp.]HZA09588.1 hypothetical protein [Mycobacterium sp.]